MVVGIANSIDLTERTLPYLKQKNIVPERLHFHTYSQDDLKRILLWRMSNPQGYAKAGATAAGEDEEDPTLIQGENMWTIGQGRVELDAQAVELCARKVAAVSGDARKLMALSNRAAIIALRGAEGGAAAAAGKTMVDISHVMEAATDVFGGQTITILRGLTQVQQLAVLAFVSMLRSGRGGDRVTLSVYYTSFVALCRQWKLDSMCCDKSEFLSVRPSSELCTSVPPCRAAVAHLTGLAHRLRTTALTSRAACCRGSWWRTPWKRNAWSLSRKAPAAAPPSASPKPRRATPWRRAARASGRRRRGRGAIGR